MSTRQTLLAAAASLSILAPALASPSLAAPLFETEPVTLSPEGLSGEAAITAALAAEGFGAVALDSLEEVRRHVSPTTNRTYLTYEQRLGGLPIYGSTVRATLEEDGTLSRLIHRIADVTDARGALAGRPSADTGLLASVAGQAFGRPAPQVKSLTADEVTFDAGGFYDTDPKASRILIADDEGGVRHGFLVQAWSKADNQLLVSVVDAEGTTLDVQDRSSSDSYLAYKVSPARGNPTIFGGWLANRTASPSGWLRADLDQRDIRIQGNNVDAYVDRDANNAADGGGARVGNGTFQVAPKLNQDAASWTNQRAAVQSAFYHLNDMHDRLYAAGFTETAGNFQRDNYGRGGRAGDHVRAEVLDGSRTNNANFSTPVGSNYTGEGSGAPRMQMFKWTYSSPHRAGSFDADIMWHEYAHGVIWRMVGDMDKPIAWAVNEGFADALAVVATNDSRIGEWARNRNAGLRSAAYEGYGRKLSDYRAGKGSRYANAEIYAAAIWEAKKQLNAAGRNDARVMDLMIDGLANTRPAPDFLDMRDGMLAAGNKTDDCAVWKAFARFGMGQGAAMSWSGSKSAPSVSVRSSTSVPGSCGQARVAPAPTVAPPPAPAPSTSFVADLNNYNGGTDKQGSSWKALAWVNITRDQAAQAWKTVTFTWSSGQTTTCRTNGAGWCTTTLANLPASTTTTTATVAKVDGRPFAERKGKSTRLTLRSPLPQPSAGSPTGSNTYDGELSYFRGGGKADGSTWTASYWLNLKQNGRPSAGARVSVRWQDGSETVCVAKGDGWCIGEKKGLSRGTASANGRVVSVNGRPFRKVNAGWSVTTTIARP